MTPPQELAILDRMQTQESISTAVTEMFNLRYPIIAAPMFLVSDFPMMKACEEAGIMGAFPALNYRPIEKLEEELRKYREQNTGALGMNIIVQSSNKHAKQHLDLALKYKVDLLISSLGNPKELIERTRGTSTKVFCDVVGMEHAKKAVKLGADGLIAVSAGAGGHAGTISPFALIPELKKELKVPLVAAGSITNGQTMLGALALGADAVYMGTRFIASKESPASPDYKSAIVESGFDDIVNTDRVDGFPGNFILTESLKEYGVGPGTLEQILKLNSKANRALSLYRAGRALFGKENQKASYKTIFSAGHGVAQIHSVESISNIVESTVREYREAQNRLP
ncbi:MAG: nitronate monooxygenase [Bdellovibrionales bacterium]|nr:nitronate monooxygenase [Bdellovibrionales bacterium]